MRFGRALPLLIAAALAVFACGAGTWPGGIGAVLRYHHDPSELYIESVPAGGAASHAGLHAHDKIVAIDGVPVATLTEDQVRQRLHGEVGSRVRLRVERDGAERDIEVERAPYR